MWIGIDTFEGAMMNLNEYRGRGFGGFFLLGGGGGCGRRRGEDKLKVDILLN